MSHEPKPTKAGSLPRVLITGATGKTGRATIIALAERYADVVQTRALVRTDDHRAQQLRDVGAEVVIGNMDDMRDVRRAMSDVQRAYFVPAVTPNSLDHALHFAVAAAEDGVEHVVAMGQWLSSASHPSLLTRRTWLVDQLVRWIPGVDYTIINVGFFADNIMSTLGAAAHFGILPFPLASGATAPISNEDIGRVVAGVLANPGPYAGQTLRPTGPEVVTPEGIAAVFSDVLGRKVRYAESSERMALKSMRASGVATPFMLAQVVHYLREYRRGTFECGGTTNVVREVTGRPAEDLTTIVRRYAETDPSTKRSLPNLVRAMGQMLKIMLTPAPDLNTWERRHGFPVIEGRDCADAMDWRKTHESPNAFGVEHVGLPAVVANS